MGQRQTAIPDVQVHVRGGVADAHRDVAVAKLGAACAMAPRPVLFVRLGLAMEENPALERPAIAKATVDVSGRLLRAHVARPTMDEAVDELVDRIQAKLRRLSGRREAAVREPATAAPGEWRRGALPTARPEYFPRPAEERRLVRRKSFALPRISPEEAAFEMDLLDHDFHLFTDASSGADCVIHRVGADELALLSPDPRAGRSSAGEPTDLRVEPVATRSLHDALAVLAQSGAPFEAFVDADSGRVHVCYVRYDGHYGLLMPGDG